MSPLRWSLFCMLIFSFWRCSSGQASRPATFGLTPEFASASKALAANQGLYNGFLAAGLVWGLALVPTETPIKIFFLACITLAGIFGAVTANWKILWVQAVPGAHCPSLVLLMENDVRRRPS